MLLHIGGRVDECRGSRGRNDGGSYTYVKRGKYDYTCRSGCDTCTFFVDVLTDFSIAAKEPNLAAPLKDGSTGHVTLTTQSKRTLRTRFHKHPVELPPRKLLGQSVVLTEHFYASVGPSQTQ